MTFVYACPNHGEFDAAHRVGEAPATDYCPDCLHESERVFTAPQFTEDRRRFAGEKMCAATGRPMAQSRLEERALQKELGIEFMTPADAPDHVKAAKEYGEHLKTGGERLDNGIAEAMMSAPKPPVKTVLERLRESGKRLGEIPTDRYIGGRPLPPFPKDVKPENMPL